MIGYKFFTENNVVWRLINGGALPIFLPRKMSILLDVKEADVLRKKMGLSFLRWEEEFDSGADSEWWHVIKSQPDTLASLPKKTRYMIKKASDKFEACPVDLAIIVEHGYEVYVDSYARYHTHEKMYDLREFLSAIRALPENTEWWGVFDKETSRMVGFSENLVEEKKCFFVTMWHRPESLKMFSGYLLFYEMEKHYLCDRSFEYISDGARSINHDTNIHNFLIGKFKYRKAYAKLRIVYNPLLLLLIKLLLPFEFLFSKLPWGVTSKVSIALNQELIRRSCL